MLADGLPCATNLRGSSLIDRCLKRKYGIGFSQAFQEVEKSKVGRQSQLGEVQNFFGCVIPSEPSAHQTAARSEDPLGCERVDGHPIVHLSLLDKALLRKYSHPERSDWSRTSEYLRTVQSKRDGLNATNEEPHVSVVSDFAKCTDGEATGTGVTEFPMTESASERIDGSTSQVYIAGIEAVVKEDSRKDSHKRRRFTGKP